jgi:hypothetical protein
MVVCVYCKKNYSNSTILANHQKTANFCIKIQNNLNNNSEVNKPIINEQLITQEKKEKEEKDNKIDLIKCNFCKKDFSSKFKLVSHLNICKQKEIEEIKKEYELKLENSKKEYELQLVSLKKEHKKEIEAKNEYIQSLNNQINTYIEKTTSHLFTNNSSISTTNNNNIVNTINIKDEEFNKLFSLIKPMIPREIKRSMEQIRYESMVNNVEPMDKYFIKCFVENFKDYMFTTDGSRGTIIIKLENGDSDKIKAVQFILDCFKIAEDKLKLLFNAIQHHLKSLSDIDEITLEQYSLYKTNLKDLVQFVLENKSNKLVNKIATELVKRSKIVKNKRLTDNKVLEDEILKLH